MSMKFIRLFVVLAFVQNTLATTHYVDPSSVNPTPPYTNWATAATVIQDAVDASVAGDEVVVTNGIYSCGGRPAGANRLTNRVAVDKPLTLHSVNGPQLTVIQGHQAPGTLAGDGAIRCVYLTNGASLSGFTLTDGATRADDDDYSLTETFGGGVWCEVAVVSNCIFAGNFAFSGGGGSYGGTLNNCTLFDNASRPDMAGAGGAGGGAAFGGTLNNCTLSANRGSCGGGALGCTLNNCTVSSNSATFAGGGTCESTLNNCTLTGNATSVHYFLAYGYADGGLGGGAYLCTLNGCTVNNNSASGAWYTNDYGSLEYEQAFGGGACGCTLTGCTLTGNSSDDFGGGVSACSLVNCIAYYNLCHFDTNNYDTNWDLLNYCCTTPMPTYGVGNITNAPLFVDLAAGDLHLQSNSPCINAGNNDYVTTAIDLDGNPRVLGGTVDIGAYEFASPELLLEHLIELVNESSVSARQSLLASLNGAQSSLKRGNTASALNQLPAFQNKVHAQVEPLDSALAAELSRLAQQITGTLEAGKGATK
jgi:hypothetical protein